MQIVKFGAPVSTRQSLVVETPSVFQIINVDKDLRVLESMVDEYGRYGVIWIDEEKARCLNQYTMANNGHASLLTLNNYTPIY